jgi:hypothetical protein
LPSRSAGCMTTPSPAVTRLPPDARRPAGSQSGSAGDFRTWPAIPPNGATLWDRLRDSSPRDRRAFLLTVAIQQHSPEAASSPGPQWVLPSKEG